MRTLLAARRLALLAVPLLVLTGAPAHALLRCAVDGGVRTHCCCPERAPQQAPSLEAHDACCCTVAGDQSQPLPKGTPSTTAGSQSLPIAFVAIALPAPRAALHGVPPAVNAAEPALGPPLVLLKSSLLI